MNPVGKVSKQTTREGVDSESSYPNKHAKGHSCSEPFQNAARTEVSGEQGQAKNETGQPRGERCSLEGEGDEVPHRYAH